MVFPARRTRLDSPFRCLIYATSLTHANLWKMGDNVADNASGPSKKTKSCFVTVGATAPFDKLIKAILEPKFLKALHDADYTELLVQHGYEGQGNLFNRLIGQPNVSEFCTSSKLKVSGFGFDKDGLEKYLRGAKDSGGAVMSHAGQFQSIIHRNKR
jgi:hypothetical protein